MSQILRKNMYKLEHPGTLIDDVCSPKDNPLDTILYSCANWVAHLCEIDAQSHLDRLIDKEKLLGFFKAHFLHWLEALSLTRNLSVNISHSQIIDTAPLQVYSSALLFSPTESSVRSNFIGKLSSWISSKLVKDSHWSPCLRKIDTKDSVALDTRDTDLLIVNKNARML